MEIKKKEIISFIVTTIMLLILTIFISIYILDQDKKNKPDKSEPEEIVYELSFKVNPLINFTFSVNNDSAIIKSFNLVNDQAKEIFTGTDFTDMEINEALDLYGDKLEESGIVFTIINVWTTWNNKDYFKSDKYNVNVNTVNKNFIENIESNTSDTLVLNKKYYSLNKNSKYDYIIFKDNGNMEYSIDEEIFMTEEEKNYYYTSIDNKLTISSKDENGYFKDPLSYDECQILYSRLKCDYYKDINNDNQVDYVSTEYFEVRN